jgi:hypothetical protein
MYQTLRPLYRVREVPQEELSTQTVLVFEDEKATKKGSTGLYEKREVKRTGKYYDVTLRQTRGEVRLSEKEFNALGLTTSGIPLMDPETGEIVRVEN